MAELLCVPLKKPSDVELVKPLKNLIESSFSSSDAPTRCTEQLQELNRTRTTAIWKVFDKYEESLDVIYSYCDQITSLECKIPAQEVQIPFKWKDAFDKGSIFGARMSLTISSLSFEKVCILFNIAALQSSIAAAQSITSDDGLKLSAKLFQQAAGIFEYLKGAVPLAVHQETTRDLYPETLDMLCQLMIAQAQEIFVIKAIHDGMKEAIIAKLAKQCEDLYSEVVKCLQKEALRPIVEKEWLNTTQAKVSAYNAVAQFHQSMICKSKKEIGEEIARLNQSVQGYTNAQSQIGNANFMLEHLNKAKRHLQDANKDNDFIYFAKIPDLAHLEPIGKALLAKATPIPEKWNPKSPDLFQDLMPVAIHQALAAYDVRKNDIVNVEINKLRESTQTLNSILASLNLPASIEQTKGNELPQSIMEKAETVKNSGGIEGLQGLMRELPDLLQRNKDILDEAEKMLREEKDSDDQLRNQFKEKWVRTPSDKLTSMFSQNVSKYRQIIENAMTADKTIHETFATHQEGIQLLSRSASDLQSNVPSSSSGGVSNSGAVMRLRKLMEDVETIKVERDVIESELKSATKDMKNVFLSALAKDGAISEPALSVTSLGELYGPLQKQVAESLARQEDLIKQIQEANTEFEAEQGGHNGGREAKLRQLASAYDGYDKLLNNLKEGIKFYNDLTQILITFQSKIGDYCFARKTEKEELMKDLTQESTRGAPVPTPTPPQHHNVAPAEPRNDPPPRPSQPPSAPAASLPYPSSGPGQMPVPYAQAGSAPYPAYVPPPQMPQGYNPYGMPYPSSGAYSGFPQAPTFQSPMQYPQGPQYPHYPGMPQYPAPGMPQYPQQQYPPYQQQPHQGWQ